MLKYETLNMFIIIILIVFVIAFGIHIFVTIYSQAKNDKSNFVISDPMKIEDFTVGDIVKMTFVSDDIMLCIDGEGILTSYGYVEKINKNDSTCNVEWRKIENKKYGDICVWDRFNVNYDFAKKNFGFADKNPQVKSLKSVNIPINNLEIVVKNDINKFKVGDEIEMDYYTNINVICGDGISKRRIIVTGNICEILPNKQAKIKVTKILNTEPYNNTNVNYKECLWNRKNDNQDSFDRSFFGECGVNPIFLSDLNTTIDLTNIRPSK